MLNPVTPHLKKFKIKINEDGSYGKPENLGSKINTEGRESYPFITKDNKLLFASDGYPGYGGLDIYVLDLDNPYALPINLGPKINYDQTQSAENSNFLPSNLKFGSGFDFILDDGSHLNEHVIYSFETLFQYVKSGGMYIVEDVATSYFPWYGGGLNDPKSMMEYFKKLTDDINFRGVENLDDQAAVWDRREDKLIPYSNKVQPDCRTDIESITFLNGIILIRKR